MTPTDLIAGTLELAIRATLPPGERCFRLSLKYSSAGLLIGAGTLSRKLTHFVTDGQIGSRPLENRESYFSKRDAGPLKREAVAAAVAATATTAGGGAGRVYRIEYAAIDRPFEF